MNMPDFVKMWNDENPFPTHQEVLQYFRDYAENFELRQYIKVCILILFMKLRRKKYIEKM